VIQEKQTSAFRFHSLVAKQQYLRIISSKG